ncbi:hypothetical protein Dimus_001876 [Dionaea muscipula]
MEEGVEARSDLVANCGDKDHEVCDSAARFAHLADSIEVCQVRVKQSVVGVDSSEIGLGFDLVLCTARFLCTARGRAMADLGCSWKQFVAGHTEVGIQTMDGRGRPGSDQFAADGSGMQTVARHFVAGQLEFNVHIPLSLLDGRSSGDGAKGPSQAGIPRSYASVTVNDMRSDV